MLHACGLCVCVCANEHLLYSLLKFLAYVCVCVCLCELSHHSYHHQYRRNSMQNIFKWPINGHIVHVYELMKIHNSYPFGSRFELTSTEMYLVARHGHNGNLWHFSLCSVAFCWVQRFSRFLCVCLWLKSHFIKMVGIDSSRALAFIHRFV